MGDPKKSARGGLPKAPSENHNQHRNGKALGKKNFRNDEVNRQQNRENQMFIAEAGIGHPEYRALGGRLSKQKRTILRSQARKNVGHQIDALEKLISADIASYAEEEMDQ